MAGPNVFIVGAEKAGSTSLHDLLGQHPQVFACEPKEPHFFSYALQRAGTEQGREAAEGAYLRLFREASEPWRLESSVSYLAHPDAAQRIHGACPDARIIVSLRDPVARAHSHFLMQQRKGLERRDETAAILDDIERAREGGMGKGYVRRGWYSETLPAYLERFEHVHVLFFEDLRDEPQATLSAIAAFLDIDAEPLLTADRGPRNAYRAARNPFFHALFTNRGLRRATRFVLPLRVRRFMGERILQSRKPKPEMPEEARDALRAFFEHEPERLATMLGLEADDIRQRWLALSGARAVRPAARGAARSGA